MARTSKKRLADNNVKSSSKIYSVGVYARLSVDFDERKNESIETQIEIAKSYIKGQEDMKLYCCYTDVGKTGTNFKREGFDRMMRDVKLGKIDCIVVKDLSRFGRNYIETGNYMEKIFPFMGVRFIAVTDHYDSRDFFGEAQALSVNLKNLINEMYARDISIKLKSSKKISREQGSFTGGIPPYGYRSDWVNGRKCLFIEENTASIVRNIYEMFLSGENITKIVAWLYQQRIARPVMYHKTGEVYCAEGENLVEWSRTTVKRILTNPVYIGCLMQRSSVKANCFRDKNDTGSEGWCIKEHSHAAIISEGMFTKVAERFEKTEKHTDKRDKSNTVSGEAALFDEMLFCGDCETAMKRVTEKCVHKNISLPTLKVLVEEAIRQEISLSAMSPRALVKYNNREAGQFREKCNKELLKVKKRIDCIRMSQSEQYMRYRMGEIDEESFQHLKEEGNIKLFSCTEKCKELTEKLGSIDCETIQRNRYLRTLVKGDHKMKLTAEVVHTLVSRIEVYPDYRVRIVFKFQRASIRGKGGAE